MPDTLFESVVYDLIVTGIAAFIGFVVGDLFMGWLRRRRYGGWRLHVIKEDGSEGTTRDISAATAERILKDENELSVFVKGAGSFYGWIKTDPVSPTGREAGLLTRDDDARVLTLDYGKDPEKEPDKALATESPSAQFAPPDAASSSAPPAPPETS